MKHLDRYSIIGLAVSAQSPEKPESIYRWNKHCGLARVCRIESARRGIDPASPGQIPPIEFQKDEIDWLEHFIHTHRLPTGGDEDWSEEDLQFIKTARRYIAEGFRILIEAVPHEGEAPGHLNV